MSEIKVVGKPVLLLFSGLAVVANLYTGMLIVAYLIHYIDIQSGYANNKFSVST